MERRGYRRLSLAQRYEVILAHELRNQHLEVARQVPIPIVYDGIEFEEGYRADLIVEGNIIVELKSVEALLPVHWKQHFTQLKLKDFRLGLLINFGEEHLKNGIRRIANNLRIHPSRASASLCARPKKTPQCANHLCKPDNAQPFRPCLHFL